MLGQMSNGSMMFTYRMVFAMLNSQIKMIFGLKGQESNKEFKIIKNIVKKDKHRQI
jgi:hypothetical protein